MTKTTIVDGWTPRHFVEAALHDWPSHGWFRYDAADQRKSTLSDWGFIPPSCRVLLASLASSFRRDAIPDLSLWGAGLCDMKPGDFLREHLDHDVHPRLGWRRVHNAILFLDGAGDLVVGENRVRIEAVPGRVCLFTVPDNPHSVETVSARRRTLSVYFYDPSEWIDPSTARTKAKFL